jgi:hypothetical protein
MVRRVLLACCLLLCLAAARCGGSTDDAARFADDVAELAKLFNASDGQVRSLLDDAASKTGVAREELARQWVAQPNVAVVGEFGDDITQIAGRQDIDAAVLRGATCDAIEQVLVDRKVPTANDVGESVEGKLRERAPGVGWFFKAQSAAKDVEKAMSDVDEGFPAGARLRLLMLKMKHC